MAKQAAAAADDELSEDDVRKLDAIADELEAEGVEVEELRGLSQELAVIEKPPGLLKRMTQRAADVARQQWAHLVGELHESREAVALIATRVKGERELSDEERAKVREQLMDLVRVFPAGLIAAANSALPFPGTSVLTPWLLVRLGLMPSRWREAHLLDQLRRQQDLLRRSGHGVQADRIAEILAHLEHEAEERELIQRESALLTHWDQNQNGVWDEEECAAYLAEVEKIRGYVKLHAARKRWFFEHEGEVYGAARLSELDDIDEAAKSLLVCFDGKTGWVALEHVLDTSETIDLDRLEN